MNPKKIKSIKKVDFFDVKELTKIEAKALKKTLQQTDSVVFGSKASRIQASKGKLPKPKDVDLATSNIDVFIKKFIDNVPKKLRKNYVAKGEKLYAIRGKTKIPILDVKPLERLIPNRSLITRRGSLPVSGYVVSLSA